LICTNIIAQSLAESRQTRARNSKRIYHVDKKREHITYNHKRLRARDKERNLKRYRQRRKRRFEKRVNQHFETFLKKFSFIYNDRFFHDRSVNRKKDITNLDEH
jgi:DNA anti-recombination protein RmuC